MMALNKISLLVFASVLSVTSVAQAQSSSKDIILPGVLDVPVIEGSELVDDCKLRESLSIPDDQEIPAAISNNVACVIIPKASADAENWGQKYAQALDAQGWTFSGGAGNAFFFEKPKTDECSNTATLMGLIYIKDRAPTREEIGLGDIPDGGYENNMFITSDVLVCGDKRKVK